MSEFLWTALLSQRRLALEADSVFAPDLARRRREQLNQLRRLANDDEEGGFGARERHRHHPAALMGQQVLGGLQQPLLKLALVPDLR